MARIGRTRNSCGVFFVDLNSFKEVNVSCGHGAGAQVLVAIAQRLREATRAEDTVGRLGDDEFVVVIETSGPGQALLDTAERNRSSISRAIDVGGHAVLVGASIGIAFANGVGAETLLHQADSALYRAKQLGGDQWEIYNEDMGMDKGFSLALNATTDVESLIRHT